jgi:hypothetical protein
VAKTHWIRGWVDCRAGLDAVKKMDLSAFCEFVNFPPGRHESWTSDQFEEDVFVFPLLPFSAGSRIIFVISVQLSLRLLLLAA